MVLSKLRSCGLTDDEIAVLSMVFFDGWGVRRIATLWGIKSQSSIQTIKVSGLRKLAAAGIVLTKPSRKLPRRSKLVFMDPHEMAEKFTYADSYCGDRDE